MILFFVRHGRAVRERGAGDRGRELSETGIATLRAAAPLWRRLNLRPDVVISSPLVRALHSAELLVEGLGLREGAVADERLEPGAGWGDLARAMAAFPDARRVAFVGHEPDFSTAVELLTGGSIRLRPGGIACVEFPGIPEPGAGELAWLLDPDLYHHDAE